jgi:predicted N-acetyltransferase YhbS
MLLTARRLPLSLLDQVRGQVRGMRDGHLEAVCRDEPEWAGRVLASRVLHDFKGALGMSLLTVLSLQS